MNELCLRYEPELGPLQFTEVILGTPNGQRIPCPYSAATTSKGFSIIQFGESVPLEEAA